MKFSCFLVTGVALVAILAGCEMRAKLIVDPKPTQTNEVAAANYSMVFCATNGLEVYNTELCLVMATNYSIAFDTNYSIAFDTNYWVSVLSQSGAICRKYGHQHQCVVQGCLVVHGHDCLACGMKF